MFLSIFRWLNTFSVNIDFDFVRKALAIRNALQFWLDEIFQAFGPSSMKTLPKMHQ